jgi:uncharacterized protein YqeY
MDLAQFDIDLTEAMKRRDQVAMDTLRGLKTRSKNEQVAKARNLEDAEIVALIRSEVKRRKEAAEAFTSGNRPEAAQKEQDEIKILSGYLPQAPSDAEIDTAIGQIISAQNLTMKDFGRLMGLLKEKFPNADGSVLAGLAKAKLQ